MTRIRSVSFDQLLDIRAHPNHGDYYEMGFFHTHAACYFVYKRPAIEKKDCGKPTTTTKK